MPIRINLLAEVQAAEDARRRDPVKRAALVAGALILVVMLWSGSVFWQVHKAQGELRQQQGRWNQNEKEFTRVTVERKEMLDAEAKLDKLNRVATNRFMVAPFLNALQQTIVPPLANNIQLEFLRLAHSFENVPAVPASKDKKIPAKPAGVLQRTVMNLRARDYGNPGDANYNKLKKDLLEQSYFKSVLQKDGVRLTGTPTPVVTPDDPTKSYYQFTLECRFQEVKRDE